MSEEASPSRPSIVIDGVDSSKRPANTPKKMPERGPLSPPSQRRSLSPSISPSNKSQKNPKGLKVSSSSSSALRTANSVSPRTSSSPKNRTNSQSKGSKIATLNYKIALLEKENEKLTEKLAETEQGAEKSKSAAKKQHSKLKKGLSEVTMELETLKTIHSEVSLAHQTEVDAHDETKKKHADAQEHISNLGSEFDSHKTASETERSSNLLELARFKEQAAVRIKRIEELEAKTNSLEQQKSKSEEKEKKLKKELESVTEESETRLMLLEEKQTKLSTIREQNKKLQLDMINMKRDEREHFRMIEVCVKRYLKSQRILRYFKKALFTQCLRSFVRHCRMKWNFVALLKEEQDAVVRAEKVISARKVRVSEKGVFRHSQNNDLSSKPSPPEQNFDYFSARGSLISMSKLPTEKPNSTSDKRRKQKAASSLETKKRKLLEALKKLHPTEVSKHVDAVEAETLTLIERCQDLADRASSTEDTLEIIAQELVNLREQSALFEQHSRDDNQHTKETEKKMKEMEKEMEDLLGDIERLKFSLRESETLLEEETKKRVILANRCVQLEFMANVNNPNYSDGRPLEEHTQPWVAAWEEAVGSTTNLVGSESIRLVKNNSNKLPTNKQTKLTSKQASATNQQSSPSKKSTKAIAMSGASTGSSRSPMLDFRRVFASNRSRRHALPPVKLPRTPRSMRLENKNQQQAEEKQAEAKK